MTKKVGKKPNPADSTMRNVRAAHKLILLQHQHLQKLEARIDILEAMINVVVSHTAGIRDA